MKNEPKLTVELIPATVFFNNVRSALDKKDWDRLRRESYGKANHKCEICGDTGKIKVINIMWSVMKFGNIISRRKHKN